MASRLVALIGFGALASSLAACIFVGPGGSRDRQTGSGGTSTYTYTSTDWTTSTTSTTTGGCVDGAGSGQTEAVCDAMEITPEFDGGPAPLCGGYDPLGHASCHKAFEIYRPGQAEDLAACLAAIPLASACDDNLVADCVDATYNDACPDPAVDSACETIGTACGSQPFDVAGCQWFLSVFNTDGVNEVIDCVNATDPSIECQPAFDACFDSVTAI